MQAVQEKLDYHFMPLLEPDPIHFNSLKEKQREAEMHCKSHRVWRPYEFQSTWVVQALPGKLGTHYFTLMPLCQAITIRILTSTKCPL